MNAAAYRWRKIASTALTLVCLAAAPEVCLASVNAQSLALLQRSDEISNIRTADSAPFRLRAKVTVAEWKLIEAGYQLVWVSNEQWREEITIGDQHAIRIGGQGVVSIEGDNEEAQAVRRRMLYLYFTDDARLRPDETLSAPKSKLQDGLNLTCMTLKGKHTLEQSICLDSASGTFVSDEPVSVTPTSVHYAKYSDFRGKLFPREIKEIRGVMEDATIQVESLEYEQHPDPQQFEAGATYKTMSGCEFPHYPVLIKSHKPMEKRNYNAHTHQDIRISYTIDEKGYVQNVTVENATGSPKAYAEDYVKMLEFEPATCGNTPVPFETYMRFTFRVF